jgi:hypothetical protein
MTIDKSLLSIVRKPFAIETTGFLALKPRRLGEVDFEPVAFALVAPGHFGAGVTEVLLHMRLFDLGGRGETSAQRMAAEREAPLALGQVAAQGAPNRRPKSSTCCWQKTVSRPATRRDRGR